MRKHDMDDPATSDINDFITDIEKQLEDPKQLLKDDNIYVISMWKNEVVIHGHNINFIESEFIRGLFSDDLDFEIDNLKYGKIRFTFDVGAR